MPERIALLESLDVITMRSFKRNVCMDFTPFKTKNPKTGTLANSEDPDEMLHQGLHSLLRPNNLQRNKYNSILKL